MDRRAAYHGRLEHIPDALSEVVVLTADHGVSGYFGQVALGEFIDALPGSVLAQQLIFRPLCDYRQETGSRKQEAESVANMSGVLATLQRRTLNNKGTQRPLLLCSTLEFQTLFAT